MSEQAYDLFARVYDAWQSAYPEPFATAILPYYEREILTRRPPAHSLLDLGCGTGIFLVAWAQRHRDWSVTGADASPGMLREARRNIRTAGVRATVRRQLLQKTMVPRPVGTAVCVFDGLNHLTRTAHLRQAMRAVARSLLPGGLFLFDLNDEREFADLFSGSWTVEAPGLLVTATAKASKDGTRGSLRFQVTEWKGGRVCNTEFRIHERNWLRPEVKAALGAAGMRVLRIRSIRPYRAAEIAAPRTLWICRRVDEP